MQPRWPANAACSIALVVTLMAVACARGDCGEVGTQTPVDTLGCFAPKVGLSDLRFVYQWGNGFYMELSNEQRMLLDRFLLKYPEVTAGTHTPGDADSKELDKAQQQFLFDSIPEQRGEKYSVYYPDRCESALFNLAGLAPKPTGDGGFKGFIGQLEPIDEHLKKKNVDLGYRRLPVLLAFRCGKTPTQHRRMDREITDKAITEKLARALSKISDFKDQEVYACREFYLEYPNRVLYLVEVKGTLNTAAIGIDREPKEVFHPSYLFCMEPLPDGAIIIPFWNEDRSIEYELFGGLMIDINDGPACDTTPVHTRVFVLPDLDGDRSCELLVDSTVTQLFRINESYVPSRHCDQLTIKLVKDSYFGP